MLMSQVNTAALKAPYGISITVASSGACIIAVAEFDGGCVTLLDFISGANLRTIGSTHRLVHPIAVACGWAGVSTDDGLGALRVYVAGTVSTILRHSLGSVLCIFISRVLYVFNSS